MEPAYDLSQSVYRQSLQQVLRQRGQTLSLDRFFSDLQMSQLSLFGRMIELSIS